MGLRPDSPSALPQLPPGYVARPLTAADIPAVFELEKASELADDGVSEVELEDIEAFWRMPEFHAEEMTAGVFANGSLVAYAQLFGGRSEATVHPHHRGRGVGAALAGWTWRVAKTQGRDRVGQTISESETGAADFFRSLGYRPSHTAWVLRLELAGPPAAVDLPAAYAFRDYSPGADDREVFDVIDRAFDEWRQGTSESYGFENWVALTLNGIAADLVVLIVHCCDEAGAGDPAEIVGVASSHDYEAEGWVEQVAVGSAHRGRGLGRALLEETFRRFWQRGRRSVCLSTDSRTGALGLYHHVGMRVRKTYVRWTKEL